MQLDQDDYQQAAIHEASHAVVAVTRGFFVFGLMLDGPDFLPGAVWRHSPEGMTVETSRDCARRELAIMVAGYLGEREFYGHNRVEWIENGDRGFIDYAARYRLLRSRKCDLSASLSSRDRSRLICVAFCPQPRAFMGRVRIVSSPWSKGMRWWCKHSGTGGRM